MRSHLKKNIELNKKDGYMKEYYLILSDILFEKNTNKYPIKQKIYILQIGLAASFKKTWIL